MIQVVGIGPGGAVGRTLQCVQALSGADVLVGYTAYIALIKPDFPDKPAFATGMMSEVERCREALRLSREGRRVAMVCSGDAAVYGMASLLIEMMEESEELEVIPGVTAALSASALLGAPLSGDMAIVSLSDLLTPWAVIEKRLRAAAEGDFCIALYNPCSKRRSDYLKKARDILLAVQPGDIPCGWARNIGRGGEEKGFCLLEELADIPADMFTTVVIGNSATFQKGAYLVTPRGYPL